MSLRPFLIALQETGHVRVAVPGEPADMDEREIAEILADLDRQARLESAFEAPRLSRPAATWAAGLLYRGCQFLVFREAAPDIIHRVLSVPCPEPVTPEVVYSVDLTLRYLPDLMTLARAAAAENDPLVAELLVMARTWPLSSVGMRDVGEVDVRPFIEHRALRQLYVDRIISRRDVGRLAESRVREAVREAIGLFPSLATEMAKALDIQETT